MSKNTLVQLIYFVGFILAGLLLSQLILFISLSVTGQYDFIELQDTEGLIQQLSARQLMTQQLISQVCSLIVPCVAMHLLFNKQQSNPSVLAFDVSFFFKVLLFFFLLMPLVGFSSYLNQLVPAPEWVLEAESRMLELMEKMFQSKSIPDFIIALVVIAVIPAIAEEWAFRGILQNYLIKLSGKKWVGLILASTIFSAVHMQFLGFLPRLLLGWILGFIYLRSGQLVYSIILHFINNAIQLIAIYTLKENSLQELLEKSDMPNLYALIICTLLAVGFVQFYFKSKNITANA